MRLPHFSEITLFATINIKAEICTATPPAQHHHTAGRGQDTDSVAVQLRWWGGSKEPSQGDSRATEDFHPCKPRHQSSWAQALGTARLRHTRLVVISAVKRSIGFTITEKAPNSVLYVKALVGTVLNRH